MLIVLAVVAFWLAVQPRGERVGRPAVDVGTSARAFADDVGWAPLVPVLDTGWRPSTARRWVSVAGPQTWQAGYARPDDDTVYVSVTQAHTGADAKVRASWVSEQLRGASRGGTAPVDGVAWEHYVLGGDPPRESLVRPAAVGGPAVLVSGLGGVDRLTEVAAALRPGPAG